MGPESGWHFTPFIGDVRQSYALLLFLLVTALHQALVSLVSASLICILVCISSSKSSFLILVKAPLLPPFAAIFGFCPLSLQTWFSIPDYSWQSTDCCGNQVVQHRSALSLPSPWPCLIQTSAFWPSPSLLWCCCLALQLAASQLDQFPKPWFSPGHVSYMAILSSLAQCSAPLADFRSHFCWHPASLSSRSSPALTYRSSCCYPLGIFQKV